MACACGEHFQRDFPADNNFRVYFDSRRATSPAAWRTDVLSVCTCCGEITSHVPADALAVLQRDAEDQDQARPSR